MTMDDINESSRKIGDIISVIDDIAFQTNILALNAAVEAARAGEQGRGFAVVAVEVRNLAQRAATAAGEIKDLISDSVDKVSDGSKLVTQAGLTMEEIVASIRGVTDMMAEITAASSEQSSGIEQVNQGYRPNGRCHPTKCRLGRTSRGSGGIVGRASAKPGDHGERF